MWNIYARTVAESNLRSLVKESVLNSVRRSYNHLVLKIGEYRVNF